MLTIRRTPTLVGVLFVERDGAIIGRIEEGDDELLFFRNKALDYLLSAPTLNALLAQVEALHAEPASSRAAVREEAFA